MKPAPFRYHAPKTIEDAVSILSEVAGEEGRILAGGQSLVPTMAFRLARPAHLIDINEIDALKRLTVEEGKLCIAAGVRHAAFHHPVEEGQLGRLLAAVVTHIAHYPIRNRGTFCGSIANADPASEWCLVAAALDGEIVARSMRGTRTIPARAFFHGVMTTALADDELLTMVRLPLLPTSACFGFSEFNRRAGDFAIAMALAVFDLKDGMMVTPRIAIGGAESVPRRITEAETILLGRVPDQSLFNAAADVAATAIEPLDDANYPAEFRRDLVRALVRRALQDAAS
jgi:aerobic carbon-monoxide dehydrogenase medium subunit